VTAKGFVFMDTPGYDPVSATGQVAGGANILCFTTGRGSAYGCKPTPSIKLATNSDTYNKMIDDMDINCGDILDGVSIEDKGREIFAKILAVASGENTRSELLATGTQSCPQSARRVGIALILAGTFSPQAGERTGPHVSGCGDAVRSFCGRSDDRR
jgi:altronate dehydratase